MDIRNLFARITYNAASSPDDQRRGRILIIICTGIIGLLLSVGVALTLLQPSPGRWINLGLAVFVFTVAATLGRKGYVAAGAYVLVVVSMIGSLSGLFLNPNSPFNVFYLLISVLLASILLPPSQIWIVLGLCLLSVAGVMVALPPEQRAANSFGPAVAHLIVLLTVSAFISFIGGRSLSVALKAANAARQQAEAATRELSATNAALEMRVEERTATLRQLAEEQRAIAEQLRESLEAQQLLNQTIARMAAPVIPVSEDTLVVPLIGVLNGEQVQQLLAPALQLIQQTRARTLIIDMTGVMTLDHPAAVALVEIGRAARLMGAETTLAGVSPQVAQILVGQDSDLSVFRTTATLRAALMLIYFRF